MYNTGNNKEWNSFVKAQVKQWSEYFHVWLADGINKGYPVLVVKYEKLKLNPSKELKRMLDFLHFKKELRTRIVTVEEWHRYIHV